MNTEDQSVCAVVVTYNRKALLAECLDALLNQTRRVDTILVVDNASTDGTPELLAAGGYLARPGVSHIRLPNNIGGAGGFHEGVRRAAETPATWLWLLDDDTIARPTALEELFAARDRFPAESRPDLLASKVEWVDGSMHPMNIPRIKRSDEIDSVIYAAEHGTVSLRATSFVSLLMHRCFVERHGLPIAEYFIWNDDVEYTARILRDDFGVLVPSSIVTHKTAAKSAPAGPRFYYAVRNQLWMVTRSDCWRGGEKVRVLGSLAQAIWRHFRVEGVGTQQLRAVGKGVFDGLFRAPPRVQTANHSAQ